MDFKEWAERYLRIYKPVPERGSFKPTHYQMWPIGPDDSYVRVELRKDGNMLYDKRDWESGRDATYVLTRRGWTQDGERVRLPSLRKL